MNIFSRYSPAIQRYIYSEGWSKLRAIQAAAGDAIFNSDANVLLSASTASGKTEAAFFPIITRAGHVSPATRLFANSNVPGFVTVLVKLYHRSPAVASKTHKDFEIFLHFQRSVPEFILFRSRLPGNTLRIPSGSAWPAPRSQTRPRRATSSFRPACPGYSDALRHPAPANLPWG